MCHLTTTFFLLAAQPPQLADRIRQGNELMAAGEYSRAAAIYGELVKLDPGNPGLRTNLGMALHLSGRDRDAIREFETALKRQPEIPPALLMMEGSWLRLGEPAKALLPLERAVTAVCPRRIPCLLRRSAASARHQAAVEHFRRWISMDRSKARAWYGLGRLYEALARAALAELERTAPESGYMLALVAAAQASAERCRSASRLYREALKREPGLGGVHAAIAEIYRKTGHTEWAAQEDAREPEITDVYCATPFPVCDFLVGRHDRAAEQRAYSQRSTGSLS